MLVGLLVAYGVILILLASLRSMPVTSPMVQLLRVFFPSWRFFDDSGDVPQLWIRTATGPAADFSSWQPCLPTPQRTWTMLLWNPQGNVRLAYDSLLLQLLADINDHPEPVSNTVSYQLTQRLVAQQIAALPHAQTITRYQFKLTVKPASATTKPEQDILLSPLQDGPGHDT